MMRTRVCLFLATPLLSLAFQAAPPPAKPEITGTVFDAGTSQPVIDAVISILSIADPTAPRSMNSKPGDPVGQIHTDAAGKFHFSPAALGTFDVSVKKDDYSNYVPLSGTMNSASVTLSKSNPTKDLRFTLSKPGTVTGQLIDSETGNPIPAGYVSLMGVVYQDGQRRFQLAFGLEYKQVDAEGHFSVSNIPPGGSYVIWTRNPIKMSPDKQTLKQFPPEETAIVDSDYPDAYWPGGRDLDSASPILVTSNASINMGRLRMKKVPLYRARLRFPDKICQPGWKAVFDIRNGFVPTVTGEAPCGEELLARHITPGTYVASVSVAGPALADRIRSKVTFQVVDKNVVVELPLARGVDITGRLVKATGAATVPFENLKVDLMTEGGINVYGEGPTKTDAEGNFRDINAQPDLRLRVNGLSGGWYVKEVLYNGATLLSDHLHLDPFAPAHDLKIVIDDKPAVIAGTVTDGDDKVPEPKLVLIRIPFDPNVRPWGLPEMTGDAKGGFAWTGLQPGDYRILAVTPEGRAKLHEPGILEGMMTTAEKISLTSGSVQNLNLKLTHPR